MISKVKYESVSRFLNLVILFWNQEIIVNGLILLALEIHTVTVTGIGIMVTRGNRLLFIPLGFQADLNHTFFYDLWDSWVTCLGIKQHRIPFLQQFTIYSFIYLYILIFLYLDSLDPGNGYPFNCQLSTFFISSPVLILPKW